jgi:hypothetical protein
MIHAPIRLIHHHLFTKANLLARSRVEDDAYVSRTSVLSKLGHPQCYMFESLLPFNKKGKVVLLAILFLSYYFCLSAYYI